MKKNKTVYIVHAVDTEGLLYESTKATFKRIEELFNIKFKIKNKKKLKELFKGKGIPKKISKKKFFSAINPHLLTYNKNWNEIKKMINQINDKKFRNKLPDSMEKIGNSAGTVLIILDTNLIHEEDQLVTIKIFDFYNNIIKKRKNLGDKVHFHFHPMTTYKESTQKFKIIFQFITFI